VEITAPLKYTGGQGRLDYDDGTHIQLSEFIVTETPDGADLEATLNDPSLLMKAIVDFPLPTRFSGSSEAVEITLTGFFAPQSSSLAPPYVAKYRCSGQLVVSATGDQRDREVTLKVEVINLAFQGNHRNEYALGSDGRLSMCGAAVRTAYRTDEIRFIAGAHSFALVQHFDYSQRLATLKNRTYQQQADGMAHGQGAVNPSGGGGCPASRPNRLRASHSSHRHSRRLVCDLFRRCECNSERNPTSRTCSAVRERPATHRTC
jgi:hypothetical protein